MGARTSGVPSGLAARGRRLWTDVMDRYVLDAGELVLLTALCRAVDVEDRLTAEAKTAPLVVTGSRKQPVAHPVFEMLRAQVKLIESLEHSLALPQPGESVGRRRNVGAVHAGNMRWNRGKGA